MKARLRAIHAVGLAQGLRPEVLAKVGDSITVDASFLTELGCGGATLGSHQDLASTIAYFGSTELPRTANYASCDEQNSWTRAGTAAGNGWSANHILRPFPKVDPAALAIASVTDNVLAAGIPMSDTQTVAMTATLEAGELADVDSSHAITATAVVTATRRPVRPTPPPECQPPNDTPLRCEIRAIRPGVAIVMFGTNDLEVGLGPATFAANLDSIVGELAAAGVIPILSTIPPRIDKSAANERVSGYNMAAIAVAKARRVPLVNFWRALGSPDMVDQGMRYDGVHPNSLGLGTSFTTLGLRYGQNQRNLTLLQTLDKVRRIVYFDGPPDR